MSGIKATRAFKNHMFAEAERHHLDVICAWCGKVLTMLTATVDHLYPKSKGGHARPDNLTIACGPCNVRKGDKVRLQYVIGAKPKCHRPRVACRVKKPRHGLWPSTTMPERQGRKFRCCFAQRCALLPTHSTTVIMVPA